MGVKAYHLRSLTAIYASRAKRDVEGKVLQVKVEEAQVAAAKRLLNALSRFTWRDAAQAQAT
jgi:hypothetical protein